MGVRADLGRGSARYGRSVAALMALAMVAAACGGSADPTTTTTIVTTSTTTPTTSTTTTTTLPATTSSSTTVVDTTADTGPVEAFRDIAYAGPMRLDVFAPEHGATGVVVLLHGRGGERARFEQQARDIAAAGAVVFNASWRYRPPRFTDGVEDAACAVRFARAEAPAYGAQPEPLIVVGFSAGAWAGSLVGLAGDEFEGTCAVAGPALADAFVGVSGAYNVARDGPAAFLETTDPETWAAINPFLRLGVAPSLEVVVVHGSADQAVPLAVAEDFHGTARAAGHTSTLIMVEGAVHLGGPELYEAVVTAVAELLER